MTTGRAHCFHDLTHKLRSSYFCDMWAVLVSWITYFHLYFIYCISKWNVYGVFVTCYLVDRCSRYKASKPIAAQCCLSDRNQPFVSLWKTINWFLQHWVAMGYMQLIFRKRVFVWTYQPCYWRYFQFHDSGKDTSIIIKPKIIKRCGKIYHWQTHNNGIYLQCTRLKILPFCIS